MQLNGLAHEERPRPKAVKSSLKGSSSQLSLEEVAAAARRNAARRHARKAADTVLKSLLNTAEKARKVCLVLFFWPRYTNISNNAIKASKGDGSNVQSGFCCRDAISERARTFAHLAQLLQSTRMPL